MALHTIEWLPDIQIGSIRRLYDLNDMPTENELEDEPTRVTPKPEPPKRPAAPCYCCSVITNLYSPDGVPLCYRCPT